MKKSLAPSSESDEAKAFGGAKPLNLVEDFGATNHGKLRRRTILEKMKKMDIAFNLLCLMLFFNSS